MTSQDKDKDKENDNGKDNGKNIKTYVYFSGPSMVTPVKKVPIHLQSAQNRVIIRLVI